MAKNDRSEQETLLAVATEEEWQNLIEKAMLFGLFSASEYELRCARKLLEVSNFYSYRSDQLTEYWDMLKRAGIV